jgi:hypothetical protein
MLRHDLKLNTGLMSDLKRQISNITQIRTDRNRSRIFLGKGKGVPRQAEVAQGVPVG